MANEELTPERREVIDEAIATLNRALQLSPGPVTKLLFTTVAVDEGFGDDPTIQVGRSDDSEPFELSPLGLVNGLFGTRPDGWGHITAVREADGVISSFRWTERESDD